jgi:hypothetical protein
VTDHDNPYAPPDPFDGGVDQQSFYEARHHAGLVFALGLVGLVLMTLCGLGFLTGLPAWILGARHLGRMRTGAMDPAGRGLTRAGKICGAVSTILSLILVVIAIISIIVDKSG